MPRVALRDREDQRAAELAREQRADRVRHGHRQTRRRAAGSTSGSRMFTRSPRQRLLRSGTSPTPPVSASSAFSPKPSEALQPRSKAWRLPDAKSSARLGRSSGGRASRAGVRSADRRCGSNSLKSSKRGDVVVAPEVHQREAEAIPAELDARPDLDALDALPRIGRMHLAGECPRRPVRAPRAPSTSRRPARRCRARRSDRCRSARSRRS